LLQTALCTSTFLETIKLTTTFTNTLKTGDDEAGNILLALFLAGAIIFVLLCQETSAKYTDDNIFADNADFNGMAREELGKAVEQELRQCE